MIQTKDSRENHALILTGRCSLDFVELRLQAIRVPEVSLRIREASRVLDQYETVTDKSGVKPVNRRNHFDLMTFVSSDDRVFFADLAMKNLSTAIVQLGLFDRYRKSTWTPQFIVGPVSGDSALSVILGHQTFEEMILRSPAIAGVSGEVHAPSRLGAEPLPMLTGAQLTEYQAFRVESFDDLGTYKSLVVTEKMHDLKRVILRLAQIDHIRHFVQVGPLGPMKPSDWTQMNLDIDVMDSTDLDPLLNWFWRGLHPQSPQLNPILKS